MRDAIYPQPFYALMAHTGTTLLVLFQCNWDVLTSGHLIWNAVNTDTLGSYPLPSSGARFRSRMVESTAKLATVYASSWLRNINKIFMGYTVWGRRNIQGYYKRNRHFQCCIETKLLMI
jgi:hypothetical protein